MNIEKRFEHLLAVSWARLRGSGGSEGAVCVRRATCDGFYVSSRGLAAVRYVRCAHYTCSRASRDLWHWRDLVLSGIRLRRSDGCG